MKSFKIIALLAATLFASFFGAQKVAAQGQEIGFGTFGSFNTNNVYSAPSTNVVSHDMLFTNPTEGNSKIPNVATARIWCRHAASGGSATSAGSLKLQFQRLYWDGNTLRADTDDDSNLLVSFTPGGTTAKQLSTVLSNLNCAGLRLTAIHNTNASGNSFSNVLVGGSWSRSVGTVRNAGP